MPAEVKDSLLYRYLEASVLGATRGIVGLPFEHPFDCVKTRWQATPEAPSAFAVSRAVYAESGFAGFYKGAVPNGTRVAIKQAYRWPLMLKLPSFYHDHLPSTYQGPTKEKIATGVTMATVDTYIVTPLERLKVWRMTAEDPTGGWRRFFTDRSTPLSSSLFRGLRTVWTRGTLSWVTFLATDQSTKDYLKRYYAKGELSYTALLGCSMIVGGVNTAVIQPFDMAKTQQQKEHPLNMRALSKTLGYLYRNHGLKGLYAGWQVRLVQYTVQSLFTVNLLDKLERKWKKPIV